jgi:hypothetical protein
VRGSGLLIPWLVWAACDETGSVTITGEVLDASRDGSDPPEDSEMALDTELVDTPAPLVDDDGDGARSDVDCDDQDPAVLPGADELCNGVDDDCSGGPDDGRACPCPTRRHDGSLYMLCVAQRAWEAAREVCVRAGQDLIVVDGLDESVYVREEARLIGGLSWWLGLSDLAQEGDWRWVDGSAGAFTRWSDGEPNDFGGEDCAELQTGSGRWNDIGCASRRPFICELRVAGP